MTDQAARALLLAACVALPWCFGGVELQYHLALAAILAPAFLLAASRFDRTTTAVRSIRVPLLLLACAIVLGGTQIAPWGAALAERLSPHALDVARDFAAVPEHQPAEPTSVSLYAAGTRWAMAELVLVTIAFVSGAALFAPTGPLLVLLSMLAITGAAVAFFGIIQKLSWNGLMYWSIPRVGLPFGPFVNRNNAGGFLTLCLAAAAGLLVWRVLNIPKLPPNEWVGERLRRNLASDPTLDDRLAVRRVVWFFANLTTPLVAAGAVVSLIAGGVLASLSRGSIVAMVVGGGATLLLTTLASRRTAAFWLAGVAVVATIGLSAWLGEWSEVTQRLATLADEDVATAEPRLVHWRNALQASRDFPIFGSGLGTYRFAYTRYERTPIVAVYHHAENQYLEALVVGGAVGLILLAGLTAEFGRRSLLLLRHARTSADFGIGAAAVGIVAMQAIHACFDFAWYVPANYLPLALTCGALMRRAAACREGGLSGEAAPTPSQAVRLGGGVALATLALGLAWSILQIGQAKLGDDARRETRMPPDDLPRRNLAWVDTALTTQRRAAEAVPDDGDTRLRMAELWTERYRFAFRREAQLNPMLLSLGPLLSVWETPAKLHADAHLLARVGNQRAIDELRRHPLVVENLMPALAEAREARRLCPLSPYPHLLVAQLSFLDESPLNDVFYVDRAERLAQGHDDWMFEIGRLHLGGARLDRACVAWRRCWELSDRFQRDILRLAFGYLTAEQLLDQIVPQDPHKIVNAARAELQGADRYFERRAFCRRALELSASRPATTEGLVDRGYCQAELGDLAAARDSLDEAIRRPRPSVFAFSELAAVQQALDDPRAAAATAEAGRTFASEHIDPFRYRARALELLEQSEPSAQTEQVRGKTLFQQGALDDAVDAFRRAVELAPTDGRPRLDLVEVLISQGNKAAARDELRAARALLNDDARAASLEKTLRD